MKKGGPSSHSGSPLFFYFFPLSFSFSFLHVIPYYETLEPRAELYHIIISYSEDVCGWVCV